MSYILEQIVNTLRGGIQTGGITKQISITPVISTGAYGAGDSIGGSIKIDGAFRGGQTLSGIIQSLAIVGENTVALIDVNVHYFATDPGAVDNAAFDPSATILAKKVPGNISLAIADDLTEFDAQDILEKTNLGMPYQVAPGSNLYAVIIASGAVTFSSTSGIIVNTGLLLD